MVKRQIRFGTAADGVRIAYETFGNGPPIVRVATWLTHLEFDWGSPVWRHWLDALGERPHVVRYDERGCGLSDRGPGSSRSKPGSPTWRRSSTRPARPLRAARRVPGRRGRDRVRGAPSRARQPSGALRRLRAGSGLQRFAAQGTGRRPMLLPRSAPAGPPAIRRSVACSAFFLPDGTPDQMAWFDELQRTYGLTQETAPHRALPPARSTCAAGAGRVAPTMVAARPGRRVVPSRRPVARAADPSRAIPPSRSRQPYPSGRRTRVGGVPLRVARLPRRSPCGRRPSRHDRAEPPGARGPRARRGRPDNEGIAQAC